MPIDPSSDQGKVFARLIKKLGTRQDRYNELHARYDNTWGIPIGADANIADAYRRLRIYSRTNFAELVVEAVRERMRPLGFRTGADGDENGDKAAWKIWQGNHLDADHAMIDRAALTMGDAYVIVGPGDDPKMPLITPEDPREVITEHDPVHKRRVTAALKVFCDEDAGVDRAYLYLPGEVWRATRLAVKKQGSAFRYTMRGWEWDLEEDEPGETLPGVVPVVRFANRRNLQWEPTGEFESHRSILDRINYTILNRLEIATMQAFKQRAVKGLPLKDEQGHEIDYTDLFKTGPAALWQLPAAAEMWESGEVDLGPIRTSIRDDVQDLAAVTRTPLFYLTPDAANGSAEGASLAREGLVFKTEDRLSEHGESYEQVLAISFAYAGDEDRASTVDMEVMWASAERFSLAEKFDAAAKAIAAGVPWRTVMSSVLGYTPQEIDRMDGERSSDLLAAAALAPPVTSTAGNGA